MEHRLEKGNNVANSRFSSSLILYISFLDWKKILESAHEGEQQQKSPTQGQKQIIQTQPKEIPKEPSSDEKAKQNQPNSESTEPAEQKQSLSNQVKNDLVNQGATNE